mmetsp:Transcript_19661/g.56372  ORF Transcript_19661/g.56372 Transcript_19661/m.56372 type:complete len:384 (-) Transcript_19661:315-1466(-)
MGCMALRCKGTHGASTTHGSPHCPCSITLTPKNQHESVSGRKRRNDATPTSRSVSAPRTKAISPLLPVSCLPACLPAHHLRVCLSTTQYLLRRLRLNIFCIVCVEDIDLVVHQDVQQVLQCLVLVLALDPPGEGLLPTVDTAGQVHVIVALLIQVLLLLVDDPTELLHLVVLVVRDGLRGEGNDAQKRMRASRGGHDTVDGMFRHQLLPPGHVALEELEETRSLLLFVRAPENEVHDVLLGHRLEGAGDVGIAALWLTLIGLLSLSVFCVAAVGHQLLRLRVLRRLVVSLDSRRLIRSDSTVLVLTVGSVRLGKEGHSLFILKQRLELLWRPNGLQVLEAQSHQGLVDALHHLALGLQRGGLVAPQQTVQRPLVAQQVVEGQV